MNPPRRRRRRRADVDVDVDVIHAVIDGAFPATCSSRRRRLPLPSWKHLVIPTIVVVVVAGAASPFRESSLYSANAPAVAARMFVEAVMDAPTAHGHPRQGRTHAAVAAAAPFPMEGSIATDGREDDDPFDHGRMKGSKTGPDKSREHDRRWTGPGNSPSFRGEHENEFENEYEYEYEYEYEWEYDQHPPRQKHGQKQRQTPPTNPPPPRERQTVHPHPKHDTSFKHHASKQGYDTYMHWCETVLGIQSVLEIKDFEYIDHLSLQREENRRLLRQSQSQSQSPKVFRRFDWLDEYQENDQPSATATSTTATTTTTTSTTTTTITVRGLAAKHAINVGDIVLSIPTNALLSIPTTIDRDPVLSRLLGPTSRRRYGWTDHSLEFEVPLLIIAILYHDSLGMDSYLWHYIDVLKGAPTEEFLFLRWDDQEEEDDQDNDKWRRDEIGEGVMELAKGIREDLYDMYDTVVGTLVREHPEVFGPPPKNKRKDDEEDASIKGKKDEGEEWAYSFDNFQWAFAMVISRHHYLPVREWDDRFGEKRHPGVVTNHDHNHDHDHDHETRHKKKANKMPDPSSQMQETLSTVSEMPPANQPTDSWVEEARFQERGIEESTRDDDYDDEGEEEGGRKKDVSPSDDDDDEDGDSIDYSPMKHPFLAPLADLINFGPPCLTGTYNPEEHAFEFIATCSFEVGQEVTFWYSSECSDVIIANYGFLHPLVPPCPPTVTKDELWEMACARHLGLTSIPIVCVNVDGYYDTFMTILKRADEDQLLYKKPHDIVHFEETPEEAVLWIENHIAEFKKEAEQSHPIRQRTAAIRKMDSNVSGSTLSVWGRMSSFLGDEPTVVSQKKDFGGSKAFQYAMVFVAGMSLGLLVAKNRAASK